MIADSIKKLRLEKNLTQAELARQLGLTRNGVNSWEQALSLPSIHYLILIAKYFNVSTDYLLGLSERTSINVEGLCDKDVALICEIASRLRNCQTIN